MFSKLALSNVKKSFRDYAVYFLTLTFGICIFYVFNSIDSQQAMLVLNNSQRGFIESLSALISYVSVFISVILGFLIIYANKFLIKRRKKELGLYMTLGMEKGRISRILILETLIIGILSLVFGLIGGIFLSHGFSVITAKLFAVDMKEFTFVFSQSAFEKSILYFGLIYLVVIVFNTISISSYKLIDLLNANKKSENIKLKKVWLSVLLFILSIAFLAASYWAIIDNGLFNVDIQFYSAFIFCFIGTFLFFFSLSGFMLKVVKSNKNLYFKNLNMFVTRQLSSKINTTFWSMTFICLMLAVTIVALSSGMSMSDTLTKEIKDSTPYDVSLHSYENFTSIREQLEKDGINLNDIVGNYSEAKIYESEATYENILIDEKENIKNKNVFEYAKGRKIPIIKLSDYNKVLIMQGKEPIMLKDYEFALSLNYSDVLPSIKYFLKNEGNIMVFGNKLKAADKALTINTLENMHMKQDMGSLIVPDSILEGQKYNQVILNINYINSDGSSQKLLLDELNRVYKANNGGYKDSTPFDSILTRQGIYDESKGLSTTVTYLTIYIGIVFLITSAAVLALQQLSQAADNTERYALLSKLGAEQKMLNKSLFDQILIYFMLPLSLAIVHSIVGISVASKVIEQLGNINILTSILMTALLFLIVYGGYFAATYLSSRNIMRPKKS